MDHFAYRDGRLTCEDVDLASIAARVGTPTYVYSAATIRTHFDRLRQAFAPLDPLICFSVKSCSNLGVLRELVGMGAGLDVVSGGELCRARLAGCPPERTVFAGVGKSEDEILSALGRPSPEEPAAQEHEPIALFNIESEGEFQAVATLAASIHVKAHAALRVNPDVDAHTHKYTTTGTSATKFGVPIAHAPAFFKRYDGHANLRLTGLHMHLGSPVLQVEPYVRAIAKLLELVEELERVGHRIDTLNIGGGFGADYTSGQSPHPSDYARAVVPMLQEAFAKRLERTGRETRLVLEPGRFIVANAGVLLTRVEYVKMSGGAARMDNSASAAKKFIICDAGMHTLVRPALYEAFHFIWPTNVAPQHEPAGGARELRPDLPGLERCDVVGPICETGDFLALDRDLPPVAPGDVLSVFTAGAYGMSMSSRYNSHPLPAEVLVDGGRARVVRERESVRDIVRHELEPREL